MQNKQTNKQTTHMHTKTFFVKVRDSEYPESEGPGAGVQEQHRVNR